MKNNYNKDRLSTQIDDLNEEVSTLKMEKKALFFISWCGISYTVFRFSVSAAIILLVVSFSFCFVEDIAKGE